MPQQVGHQQQLFRGVALETAIKDALEKGRSDDGTVFLDLSAGARDPLRSWLSASLTKQMVSSPRYSKIVEIDLSGNALTGSLSDGYGLWQGALGTLRRLDVSRCRLRSLKGIEVLSSLRVCTAQGNVISCLNKTVPADGLEAFDLSGNALWNLGECVEMCTPLTKLKHLSLRGNPLCEHVRDWQHVVIYSLVSQAEERMPFFLDGQAITGNELEVARQAVKGGVGSNYRHISPSTPSPKKQSEEEEELRRKNAALEALLLQAAGRQDAAAVALAEKEAQVSSVKSLAALNKTREFVLIENEKEADKAMPINTPLESDRVRIMITEAEAQLGREKNRLAAARRRLLRIVGALAEADAAAGDESHDQGAILPTFTKSQVERALAALDDVDPEAPQRCLRDSLRVYRRRLENSLELARQIEQIQTRSTTNLVTRISELTSQYDFVLQQENEALVIARPTPPTVQEKEAKGVEEEEEDIKKAILLPQSTTVVERDLIDNSSDVTPQSFPPSPPSLPGDEKEVRCIIAEVQTATVPPPVVAHEERWRERVPPALVPDCDYILGEDGTGTRAAELLRGLSAADLELRLARLCADRERTRRMARLELCIVAGRDLPPMKHATQSADCYAVASLTFSGLCHKRKTQVVRNSRFPEWRQALVLPAPAAKLMSSLTCTVLILHRPRVGDDEFVAQAAFDLAPLYTHQHWTKRWLRLHQVQSMHSSVAKRRRLTPRSAVRVEARVIHDPTMLLDRAIAIVEHHLRNSATPLAISTPSPLQAHDKDERPHSPSHHNRQTSASSSGGIQKKREGNGKSKPGTSPNVGKKLSFADSDGIDQNILNIFKAPHHQQRSPSSVTSRSSSPSSAGRRPPWRTSGPSH